MCFKGENHRLRQSSSELNSRSSNRLEKRRQSLREPTRRQRSDLNGDAMRYEHQSTSLVRQSLLIDHPQQAMSRADRRSGSSSVGPRRRGNGLRHTALSQRIGAGRAAKLRGARHRLG